MLVDKQVSRTLVLVLAVYGAAVVSAYAQSTLPGSRRVRPQPGQLERPPSLHYVRSFASAKDVGSRHPVLDRALNRTLDIVAGPAGPSPRVETLQLPAAVATDSHHQVFVADPRARAVHIFDFAQSRYRLLDARDDRLGRPVALAVDAEDNLYVADENSRTILEYDSAGTFRRRLGQLRGGESYFDSPYGIAIDRTTGYLYVCDTRRNMLVVMDERGRLVERIGKRGGGDQPGDFRAPTQVVVANGELFVLDAGNRRVQILDAKGRFRRAIQLTYADHESGLTVDRDNNVYVSNSLLSAIQVFSHEGRLLSRLDSIGAGPLTIPTGLWMADECLYVVESGEHARVSVFEIGTNDARHCR